MATNPNKMGNMPIPKLILSMALPAMISMLVQAMYNVVDSIFVARISENALTAVSLAFPMQLIVVAAFVGLGIGMNANISKRLGAGDTGGARSASAHGFMIGLILSALVALVGIFGSRAYFTLFTQDLNIINQGTVYVQIVTILSVFRIMAQTATSTLQGSGEMVHPMIAQLVGAVLNIILDPLMIFGLFGFPASGVAGAAIATVLSQAVSMTYIWFVMLKGKGIVKPALKGFVYNGAMAKSIVAVGLPAAIMQGLGSVMLAGVNVILAPFGATALAVMGVYFKLQSMVFMPVFGLNTGTLPVVGFNFGAKNLGRLFGAVRFSTTLAVVYMSLCALVFQVFPGPMLQLFKASPQMLAMGVPALKIISLSFPLVAVTIIVSGAFNGLGRAQLSLVVSLVRQFVVLLPVAYFMGRAFGLVGVWYGFVAAELAGILVTGILFFKLYRKLKK